MKRNALKREEMREKYWTTDGKKAQRNWKKFFEMKHFFFIDFQHLPEWEKKNGLQWIYLTDRRMKLNMQFMYFKWTFRNCLYALMMAARRFRYMIMTIVAVCPQTNFHGVFFQDNKTKQRKKQWFSNILTEHFLIVGNFNWFSSTKLI